jgi:hypothetical protein
VPTAKLTPGRPTKLSPEIARAITDDLLAGMPPNRAAEFAGIDPTTLSRWLDRGMRQRKGIYRDFWDDFRTAQGEAYREALTNVRKAALRDARYSQWWLSRIDPRNFGRRDNVEQDSSSDRPEPGSVVAMLEQRLARLAQVGMLQLPNAAGAAEADQPSPPVEPALEPEAEQGESQEESDAPGE